MNVSVIIPTHNKSEYISLVLASFINQTRRPDEIIVVDDGSSDATAAALERYSDLLPLVVVKQSQRGRAGARNSGLRRATGQFVIFCDDDRVAAPDFVECHWRALMDDPLGVYIGWKKRVLTIWRYYLPLSGIEYEYLQRNPNFNFPEISSADQTYPLVGESMITNEFQRFVNKCVIGDEIDNRADAVLSGSPLAWMFGTTANLSFVRTGIEGVFFDERYNGWGVEDTDFTLSLVNAGRRVVFADHAINYHQVHPLGGTGLRNARAERMAQANANLDRFCEKHRSIEAHLYRRVQQGMSKDAALLILEQVKSDSSSQLEDELRTLYAQQTFAGSAGALGSMSGNTLGAHDRVSEFLWDGPEHQSRPVPATQQADGRLRPAQPRTTPAFAKPLITHKWWTPMLWRAEEEIFCSEMFPLPLSMKAHPRGMGIGYPKEGRVTPDNRTFEYPYREDMTLQYAEDGEHLNFGIQDYSEWTVDAIWAGSKTHLRMRAIQGSPTVHFWGEGSVAIHLFINGGEGVTLLDREDAIIVHVNSSAYLICFTGCSVQFDEYQKVHFSPIDSNFEISVHLLPEMNSEILEYFLAQGTRRPKSSRFSWSRDLEDAKVRLEYRLVSDRNAGTFLQALLPHQWRNAAGLTRLGEYSTARGRMVLVDTNCFELTYDQKGFLPHFPVSGDHSELVRLLNELTVDSSLPSSLWPQPLEGWSLDDGYWAGKSLVRLGDLLNIAREIKHDHAAHIIAELIKEKIEYYFSNSHDAGFYYDAKWSTMLYRPCAVHGVAELMNDHGYYYGYYLRAAVAVGLYDPEWLNQVAIKAGLKRLLSDVANPDQSDSEFPFLRCFDPFAGHSWGSGNGSYSLGLNAEPSSESINFAASVALLGALWGDRDVEDFGIVLYTSEVETTLDYWFNRHGDSFPSNFKWPLVGMLWSSGGSNLSWFKANTTEAFGVNLLPMQASSIYLLGNPHLQNAIKEVYAEWESGGARWGSIYAMVQGLLDPKAADRVLAALSKEEAHEWSLDPVVVKSWIETLDIIGLPVSNISCNLPFYTVFERYRVRYYWVFNPTSQPIRAIFSDGVQFTIKPGVMQGLDVALDIRALIGVTDTV